MSGNKEPIAVTEWRRDAFVISTDPARVPVEDAARWLAEHSYWARGVPPEVVARAVANSLTFGLYVEQTGAFVGMARVITDRATFAYLADVFVREPYRGRGLSKWLMEVILAHPDLQGLRRWLLMTADAHSLYARYGFRPLHSPERVMERHDRNVYQCQPGPPLPAGSGSTPDLSNAKS
jgi:GNAT superfamily N-acetyltransferase